MKSFLATVTALLMLPNAFSQQMHVKQPNFTSFREDIKAVSENLSKKSSPEAQKHPEFGILPYNAQCKECTELIDKRTANSRLFIEPKNAGHTYSQQSYFPLHYKKSEDDIWRTIDIRLRPDANNGGVYVAKNQPSPTKLDLNKKCTSLDLGEFEFEFNKNLSMYFFDEKSVYTKTEMANYSDYTIGEEGLQVKNIWNGITMQQLFAAGRIKTNYLINAPLQLPISSGWLVIEDHFTLPAGYVFEESRNGDHINQGYYRGDYFLRNAQGDTLAMYEKPIYVDGKAFGMHGIYNLLWSGNDYTLQMLVPVEWLKNPDNTYPLNIDPNVVAGITKIGNFRQTGLLSGNMGFTTMSVGSCDYLMTVVVPGKSTITNAYVDLEYQLTYDNTCGVPPLPPPFCTFSQASMEVVCPACSTTTGILTCNPANPPYTGTCTTDSNLVPGAHSILINSINPNYLQCIQPQCNDFNVGFTLKDRDSICGDVCGYLCARGNMWQMTVEALRVDGTITQYADSVCAGTPVTFTAQSSGGVPPYYYMWSWTGGHSIVDTANAIDSITIYPQSSIAINCNILCSCPPPYNNVNTDTLNVTVLGPTITIQGDTLICSTSASYQWYRNDTLIIAATSQSYIATLSGTYSVDVQDSFGCNATITIIITGIQDFSNDSELKIYPNPNSTSKWQLEVNKDLVGSELEIFDAEGRLVLTTNIKQQTSNLELNVARGIYLLRVSSAKNMITRKLVRL